MQDGFMIMARQDAPFVAINCSTIPDKWLSQNYSGTKKSHRRQECPDRLFEAADHGTLSDEITSLSLEARQNCSSFLRAKS